MNITFKCLNFLYVSEAKIENLKQASSFKKAIMQRGFSPDPRGVIKGLGSSNTYKEQTLKTVLISEP